jgi:NAD(P)-dependent dehydrogenase (short-subunit alcohol dehydrogenase family)
LKLEGQVAIVTGAGSKGSGLGTGKAMAVLFAREGAKVVLVDRNPDRLDETRGWIEDEGGTAAVVTVDLGDPTAPRRIVDEAVEQFGRIDILVPNAAAYGSGKFLDTTPDALQEVVAVNLISPFMLSQAAIPVMIDGGGGSIIFISSVLALRGGGNVAYAATKASLSGMTTSLANTFGTEGIRVNCIVPGMVETPVRNILAARAGMDLSKIDIGNSTSLGVQGDAWDVAQAALFLGSADAKFVTGVMLPVDGGNTTRLS